MIVLNTDMNRDPKLTAATLINHLVGDLLFQRKFEYAHLPELVDLAVVSTGLGILQSNLRFVKKVGSFWDSTYWTGAPRPFLDSHGLAYANAVAAWVRGEKDPAWASELPDEIQRPARKSLKYLFKSNDSFFHPSTAGLAMLGQSQSEWLHMASQSPISKQVVSIRSFEFDEQLQGQQEKLLLEKLQSRVRPLVLHAISAVEKLNLESEPIADELRFLVEDRDDEIRAKAMIALAKLGKLDEMAISHAVKMVDSSVNFVVFAGVSGLSSLESVPDDALRVSERVFVRALQTCDYVLVGLFASAFNRWLENPQAHIERLLQNDQPEYLVIALEALGNAREQSVAKS